MNDRVKDMTGVIVTAVSGEKYRLKKIVGNGSQGVVYEEDSGKYMVKFYYPTGSFSIDDGIYERLKLIKDIKTPKNFVAIVDIIESPYVGYVMERVNGHISLKSYLIPDRRMNFAKWYNKDYGLRGRIFLGYMIAKAFRELEINNLSYCDISGDNILVNISNSASVKMIDIDNIYIAGGGQASILGTPRYIAPEVINRQKNPDVLSDNYSLAVILFELIRVGHPYISDDILDGTPEDEDDALAGKADYVTESNSSNMLPEDFVFTDKLKSLFRRCFVEGKNDRIKRPAAAEFEKALLEASNKVIKCSECDAWHYPRKEGRAYAGCPWCGASSRPNAMLNFYDMLYEGEDYEEADKANKKESAKLVNSYVLRDGKNHIKSLYILRYDDVGKEKRTEGNYFTIAKDAMGYHAYNEFSKTGIKVKKYATQEFKVIPAREAVLLGSGDEIYFEICGEKGIGIECGGRHYTFIRAARFMEVKA